jgi:integrase/recombinase XerD
VLQKLTVRLLTAWLTELHGPPESPLFPTGTGITATPAVAKLVARHIAIAVEGCLSLGQKNVTPHTLRHTCAMMLLHAEIDTAIALWLGHATIQTTQPYLYATWN